MAGKAGAVRAGRAFVELSADDSKLQAGLRAAATRFRAWGMSMVKIGATIMGVGTAISGAFLAAAKSFATAGAAIDDASKRTGLAVESLSQLSYAADQSGTSFEAVTRAVAMMQKNLVKGGGPFKQLGLDADELLKLSPEKQMLAIADAIDSIANPAERTAAAMAIFGKSGAELLPLFEGGAAELGKLFREAGELGVVFDADSAAKAAALDDAFAKLSRTMKGLWNTIGKAVAPAMTAILDAGSKAIAVITKWVNENARLVKILAALGVALSVTGSLFTFAGVAFIGLSVAASAVASSLSVVAGIVAALSSPMSLAVSGIVAFGGAAFYAAGGFEWLGKTLQWLFAPGGIFRSAVDALAGGMFIEASQLMWKRLEQIWVAGVLKLKTILWDLMDALGIAAALMGKVLGIEIGGVGDPLARGKEAAEAAMRLMQLQKEILELQKQIQGRKDANGNPLPANNGANIPGFTAPGLMSRGPGLTTGGTFSAFSSRMFASPRSGLDRIIPIWVRIGREVSAMNKNLKENLTFS